MPKDSARATAMSFSASRAIFAIGTSGWRSAEVHDGPTDAAAVSFGSTVTLERDDGRIQKFRIVGEDESDPPRGKISYVSPLAQAMMEKSVGDTVKAGAGEAEITKIE